MQEYVNKYGKTALYTIGSLIVMYLMIYVFTPKPEIPLEYKHALDSLNRANADLVAKQKEIDALLGQYELQLHNIDSEIEILENRKAEIHNHYQVVGEKVDKFTPTQIDSFFKARYNY